MDKNMALKIISLNIEHEKHLESVTKFLSESQADVVCLMEVLQPHLEQLKEATGASFSLYAPMTQFPVGDEHIPFGVCILSRVPVTDSGIRYYFKDANIPVFVPNDDDSLSRALVYADCVKDGVTYRIGATHFTWTPDGGVSPKQEQDLTRLFGVLDTLGDVAFMGDFNAPRGGEIFAKLASKYTDNIPAEYFSSLDPRMHRAGGLELMVDGLFTTPGLKAENVKLTSGVSDHCAITANLSKP
jgi:endonuclease/exonuclease/phosphatase family metal-dependent hydrolase